MQNLNYFTKFKYGEFRFLIYFVPIYFLKLLNMTPASPVFSFVSVMCFVFFLEEIFKAKFDKKLFCLFIVLFCFSSLLIITCGKQGFFFSIIFLIALNSIESFKRIYLICFIVGIIGTMFSMYIERNGTYCQRYIYGVWTEMYKRSNILFISFFTCIALYILQKRKVTKIGTVVISILGYLFFRYTGSRTGLIIVSVLVILLLLFSYGKIGRNKVVQCACVFSPIICLIISFVASNFYGICVFFNTLNSYMQGRLALGKKYLDAYSLKMFGQKIYESSDIANFWNLDCAYLYMMIGYGMMFSIFWIFVNILTINWLYTQGRYTEVALLVTYAVYGISETFLPNCFLNMSWFLFAEYFYHFYQQKRKLT